MKNVIILLKILFLGITDALGIWSFVVLWNQDRFALLGIFVVALAGINIALSFKTAQPLRYILPGLLFFILMVLYPIVYNLSISFTNYGTGHLLSKEQVIEQFENQYYTPQNAQRFTYQVFEKKKQLKFLFHSKPADQYYLSRNNELMPVNLTALQLKRKNGVITNLKGFNRLNQQEMVRQLGKISNKQFHLGEKLVTYASISSYHVQKRLFRYDVDQEVLINQRNGKRYKPINGTFTDHKVVN